MHVRPGYRENRLICKGHLITCDFTTKYQGRTDPTMKIGMHIFSACKATLQETAAHAFFLLVLQDLPIHLKGLRMPYDALTCILHPY